LTGHSKPEVDIFYALGMLAARFLVYVLMFIYTARDPMQHRLWIAALLSLWRPRPDPAT
jgi:hypothetical protein